MKFRLLREIAKFAVLALTGLWIGTVHAEIRKWTDKEGRVHYSDQPPAGAVAGKVEILPEPPLPPPVPKPAPAASSTGAGDGRTTVGANNGAARSGSTSPATVEKARVWIYVTRTCVYCKQAKSHLARRGVEYTELDIDASAAAREEFRQLGARGVPVILVGDKRLNGYSPKRLDALLQYGGY